MRGHAQLMSSADEDWRTPGWIVDLVEQIYAPGGIDLDPCSELVVPPLAHAVRAHEGYTVLDDGLKKCWFGNVYTNPPYGAKTRAWIQKADREWRAGNVDGIVALVAARTDTLWFQECNPHATCFLKGRLRFTSPAKPKATTATFPSALLYWGPSPHLFAHLLRGRGKVHVHHGD